MHRRSHSEAHWFTRTQENRPTGKHKKANTSQITPNASHGSSACSRFQYKRHRWKIRWNVCLPVTEALTQQKETQPAPQRGDLPKMMPKWTSGVQSLTPWISRPPISCPVFPLLPTFNDIVLRAQGRGAAPSPQTHRLLKPNRTICSKVKRCALVSRRKKSTCWAFKVAECS